MHADLSYWVGLIGGIVILVGYLVSHILVAVSLKGPWSSLWRVFSFLPVPVFGYVLFITVVAFQAESNLWPIIMIFYMPVECVYLTLLMGLHLLTRKKPAEKPTDSAGA